MPLEHEPSVIEPGPQEPEGVEPDVAESKKWFHLKEMKSWKLVLTPNLLSIIFLAFAIVLIPLGVAVYIINTSLSEIIFDYTQCIESAGSDYAPPASNLSGVSSISRWRFVNGTCDMEINVPTSITGPVFMYVRITNMLQNHRLYIKSLDQDQLKGKLYRSASDFSTSLSTSCDWLQYANCDTAKKYSWKGNDLTYDQSNPDCFPPAASRDTVIQNADPNAQYYPCGLIANSMFSDDVSNMTCISGSCLSLPTYDWSEQGIAWKEDASQFGQTAWAKDASLASQINTMVIPPPAWRSAWPEKWRQGYNQSNLPNLQTWERFQVWMRKAGLPTFRKLWGKNSNTLESGIWKISIRDTWNCRRFGGTKSIVISKVGLVGTRNPFLGIVLITVGVIIAAFGLFVALVRTRKLGDHAHLSWNKEKSD